MPKVGEGLLPLDERIVESDAEGRIKVDGIVPGLPYRIRERTPPHEGPFPARVGGTPLWYDKVPVLAPEGEK